MALQNLTLFHITGLHSSHNWYSSWFHKKMAFAEFHIIAYYIWHYISYYFILHLALHFVWDIFLYPIRNFILFHITSCHLSYPIRTVAFHIISYYILRYISYGILHTSDHHHRYGEDFRISTLQNFVSNVTHT